MNFLKLQIYEIETFLSIKTIVFPVSRVDLITEPSLKAYFRGYIFLSLKQKLESPGFWILQSQSWI